MTGKKFINIFLLFVLLFLLFPFTLQGQSRNVAALYSAGRNAMIEEAWFDAVESFLEVLRINSSHAQAAAALAECYYAISEFDQALSWVRRARTLARGNLELANLEGRILIAQGRLNEAARVIGEVLSREPYNRNALFAQAEMEIARGRSGEAVIRYREAIRRHPDDQRLLMSLALVLGSMGQHNEARTLIDRVLAGRSEDHRVHYYAAYLASQGNRVNDGIRHAERALFFRSNFEPAKSLLAQLRYRNGQFGDAVRLADEIIANNRNNADAWYLKGMALSRLGRNQEAITTLSGATSIAPDDEFIRSALTELLINRTALEDPVRRRWASWHFTRARDFRSRNLNDQAMFEYRRGLRLNPYARERQDYAELLRIQGFPARFMEELRFMQDLGLGNQGIDDMVETFNARLASALFRRWQVEPLHVTKRHWKVAVFAVASQSGYHHVDGAAVVSAYLRDLLVHNRNITPMNLELRQASFSSAFRTAREGGADYFIIVNLTESQRDISLKGELFVGRTGSPAGTFSAFRTGPDRLRNAGRHIIDQLSGALPFRAELVSRRANQGLIDKGRADGVRVGTVYNIVNKGRISTQNDNIGLIYAQAEVIGTFTVTEADEEVAAGNLARIGFHDRIEPGDEIVLQREPPQTPQEQGTADPELRAMLRTLR